MRDDERQLLRAMQQKQDGESARDIAARLGIPSKRADFIFHKWSRKRWYDYGVSLDMGWLEPAGMAVDTSEQG